MTPPDPCPNCGRLTHLSVCIHCGISRRVREPEMAFHALDFGCHFRLPGSTVIFTKIKNIESSVAEVIHEMLDHPEAPRSGSFHPQPERRVIFVPHSEVASLRAAAAPEGTAGLIALELDADGTFWFIFSGPAERQAFLAFAAGRQIHDAGAWRLVHPRENVFAAGVFPSQLLKPFILPIASAQSRVES